METYWDVQVVLCDCLFLGRACHGRCLVSRGQEGAMVYVNRLDNEFYGGPRSM
jgi:hypothetical protein